MIPAGILNYKEEVLPEGLEPLESWTIGNDFRILSGNTIEYFKGDGSIATSHKIARPGTPFEFQWSAFPNLKGKGANVWLSTTLDTSGKVAYMGHYWSNSTSITSVWFSTTTGAESSASVGNISNLLLRYRGDGTKIYREYSLNGGTSWVEVAGSNQINHTVDIYFVVEMYDYVSSGIGSRVNDIKQQGLYSFDFIRVGSGSGGLLIDGSLIINPNSLPILVTEGWYSGIELLNFYAPVESPVTIKNEGTVTITGAMTVSNVENIIFSGRNTSGVQYGWQFTYTFRPLLLSGGIENATFEGMSFANTDYPIFSTLNNTLHDGTKATRTTGLKIKHSSFVNTPQIEFGGDFYTGTDRGFMKDLEVAYNTFSGGFNALNAGNVDGYQIHHNVVNNNNVGNDNHNGVFKMGGAGDFYSNKLTNYQGNSIRAWAFSRVGGKLDINIYDNICYNTRKYGAFELQGFGDKIVPDVTVMTNCKVYNNTVGTMNTSKDWEGVIVDIYSWLGTIEINKNLGFDLYKTTGAVNDNNMMNAMGSSYTQSGNRYFPLASDAVVDLVEFKSKITGVGAGEIL